LGAFGHAELVFIVVEVGTFSVHVSVVHVHVVDLSVDFIGQHMVAFHDCLEVFLLEVKILGFQRVSVGKFGDIRLPRNQGPQSRQGGAFWLRIGSVWFNGGFSSRKISGTQISKCLLDFFNISVGLNSKHLVVISSAGNLG
jgi:hypothetical protein